MTNIEAIDIVIPWVDGSDKAWYKKYQEYKPSSSNSEVASSRNRYNDWGTLMYLFRGIEKFLPWIRKVHFITEGHLPDWLNVDCERLNIVKHSDYFKDDNVLPTFNANPILLNLAWLDDLSENFILFNDDTFVLDFCEPTRFFNDNLPVDFFSQSIRRDNFIYNTLRPKNKLNAQMLQNNIDNLNSIIDKSRLDFFSEMFMSKNYSIKARGKNLFFNLISPRRFTWIDIYHQPQAHLKSTYRELWSILPKVMEETVSSKFRCSTDITEYLCRFYNLVRNKFTPKMHYDHLSIAVFTYQDMQNIDLHNIKFLCVSDGDGISESDFNKCKLEMTQKLDALLPEISSFEKER
ncbi:Stealth CR1 domain-containing protein [Colwellia piezophila]|uniref:Stealth CR1 domain-containing protein n=1 Tax=Colwellia piezophila TaxID=211668 RepID=UPI00037B93E1|nr:stealth family protein [Colwellia piezophila]